MPKAPPLSDSEKDQIKMLQILHFTPAKIAQNISRSPRCVYTYLAKLRAGLVAQPKSKPGPKHKISERSERAIGRNASNQTTSSAAIQLELNIQASPRTVRRSLKNVGYLNYKLKPLVVAMTKDHKKRRVDCCKARRNWMNEWHRVIFSDEKKFNEDGPDGWRHYYHDVRKPEVVFPKRQGGGTSLMFWGAFGFNGKSLLVCLKGNQNAEDYQNTLDEHLAPCFDDLAVNPGVFQQDGASIHTAGSTLRWFHDRQCRKLAHPAKSPDLNPMENLWSIVERAVYARNKQYQRVADLKAAVIAAWDAIPLSTLRKLVDSMHQRTIMVIESKGETIKL
jgi:transposase